MSKKNKLKKRLKSIPLVRWAWRHAPNFVRNWVGHKKPDLSIDDRPPMFRLANEELVRLRPQGEENLIALEEYLSTTRLVLHISEGRESIHHIDTWGQFCSAADTNLLIVLRSRPLFERVVKERPSLNIIYVRNGRQAEWLINHMPNARAVLYGANTGNIIHFIRFPELRHIFLGHGDSEKAASCGKHFRNYDEIWTAGQAHIDRFQNKNIDFSSLRFRIIGRPQGRDLLRGEDNCQPSYFLYLPTWESYHAEQDYSSILTVSQIIPKIPKIIKRPGLVKFHPFTGKRNKKLKKIEHNLSRINRKSYPSFLNIKYPIHVVSRSDPAIGLMNDSLFLITDISSVISDFLVTGRPIFVYIPSNAYIKISASSIPLKAYCYVFSTPEELITLINLVIVQGNDSLHNSRLSARDYFVNTKATREKTFESELRKIMNDTSSPADAIRLLTHDIR